MNDFFIHNDDVEYCIRLSKMGKILLSVKAGIYHLENALNTDIPRKFLNHKRNRPAINKLWIRYYGTRNIVWIKKKYLYNKSVLQNCVLLLHIGRSLFKHTKDILLYDDFKMKRFNFYLSAYIDGWYGRFDNDKPRKMMN